MDEIELLEGLRPEIESLDESEIDSIWSKIGSSPDVVPPIPGSPSAVESESRAVARRHGLRARTRRHRALLAGVAAVGAIALVGVGVMVGSHAHSSNGPAQSSASKSVDPPTISDATSTDSPAASSAYEQDGGRASDFASGSSASCALSATPAELQRRAFAFSGTVESESNLGDGRVRTVYSVDHWFRGGDGTSAIVISDHPGPGEDTDGPVVGRRRLIAGEIDPIVPPPGLIGWGCGFTRDWSESDALIWEAAFR